MGSMMATGLWACALGVSCGVYEGYWSVGVCTRGELWGLYHSAK